MKIIDVSKDIQSQKNNAQRAFVKSSSSEKQETQETSKKTRKTKGYSLKRFDQTRIGFLLAHEVPIEYKLLMETVKSLKLSSPSAELIEAIAYASNDPFFAKQNFGVV